MKKTKPIDDFEAAWMKDIDKGNIISDAKAKKRLLRISDADLEAIQIRAAKEGIPYQTFIKSILHKIATNQIDV